MHVHIPMSFLAALRGRERISFPEYEYRDDHCQGMVVEASCEPEYVGNLFAAFAELVVKHCDGVTFEDFKQEIIEVLENMERIGLRTHDPKRSRSFEWNAFSKSYFEWVNERRTQE